ITHKYKYFDEYYEYRHVVLPGELSEQVPKIHLMSEEEQRRLGVQSLGWVHDLIHESEPHILLFRRPLPKEQLKGSLSGVIN
uniref:Cyclin-dependent kinases regulatory subunit n=1 Tax=Spermophilus dauricus TaxID=99837 RepID=A0A8C9PFU3_SPEDA